MTNQGKIEFRMVDLETRISYQDETLEQLNSVIISQQEELDELKQVVSKLSSHLKSIQGEKILPSDEAPPPHY